MNKLVKNVLPNKLSHEFLRSLNGIMGLTERELQVLSALLDLHMANPKRLDNIDSSLNRRKLMAECNVSRENLSRYIRLYKSKGVILEDKDTGLRFINKALVPNIISGKTVQIVMILKLDEDEKSKGKGNMAI